MLSLTLPIVHPSQNCHWDIPRDSKPVSTDGLSEASTPLIERELFLVMKWIGFLETDATRSKFQASRSHRKNELFLLCRFLERQTQLMWHPVPHHFHFIKNTLHSIHHFSSGFCEDNIPEARGYWGLILNNQNWKSWSHTENTLPSPYFSPRDQTLLTKHNSFGWRTLLLLFSLCPAK